MNVLVVDDDPMARGLVTRFVSRAGHRVVGQARDGVEGIDLLSRVSPDIVVTDCQMPNMDGVAMVRQMRASGNHSRVVMLSGQSDKEVIRMALGVGVDVYLTKPMDPSRLIAAMTELCGSSKAA